MHWTVVVSSFWRANSMECTRTNATAARDSIRSPSRKITGCEEKCTGAVVIEVRELRVEVLFVKILYTRFYSN